LLPVQTTPPVYHKQQEVGLAYKPSPIQTILSASESHRICQITSQVATDSRLAGLVCIFITLERNITLPHRRSGIAPCPEGLYERVCHKTSPFCKAPG